MKKVLLIATLSAQSVTAAEPVFENMSSRLPHHVYSGGWEHFVGGGLAIFDCNADGLPDVFAAGGENPAKLLVNEGDFRFADAPMPEIGSVVGSYPLDMDSDGHTDLFVLRAGVNIVLRGIGDCGFEDATEAFSMPASDRWSTSFSAWWDDGQDRPSLAVGNYVDRTDPNGPFEACDVNEILWPQGGTYTSEVLSPGFCPLSILAAQDARGKMTLRLSNDRHYYVKAGYEQMWDITERRFLGPQDGWEQVSLWGMGIASRDLTGDGRDEVMLTSMGDQLMQIARQDGTYTAAPYNIGTYAQRPHIGDDGRPSTGWHAEFGDVDNDGLADLFMAKGNVDQMPGMAMIDPNNLLIQNDDGTFRETAQSAGVASVHRSRGAGLADFNGDGLLDIIVSNRRAPLELYRNVTPDTGNWMRIDLEQSGGNRNAIGAVIQVETSSKKQSVQHVIGGGHAGGQFLPRHFGLGQETAANVTVQWPDGSTSIHVLSAGKTHKLTKP